MTTPAIGRDRQPEAADARDSREPLATEFVRAIAKHWLLLVATWAVIVAATFFFTLGQRRIYRAEAMLRLDPDPPRPLGNKVELLGSNGANYWARKEFYETEFRVLRSMRVATAVVRSLQLNTDPGFVGKAKGRPSNQPLTVEQAAEILVGRLSVEPIKESSLALVRYEDTDPKRCKLVLSTLVRIYLEQNLENTTTVSTTALEWLNGQLDHLRLDLEKSEKALNDFRLKNNVVSLSLEDRHNLISGQLDQVGKARIALEIQRYEIAARYAEIAKAEAGDPEKLGVKELLENNVLVVLRTSYAEQTRLLDELSANLGEEHPKVVAAKAKLAAIAKSIRAEVSNVRAAVKGQLSGVDRQLGDLARREEEILKQAHDLQALAGPFNQLERTKTYNEKIYGMVLERARETDLTRMMNFNNVRVIDEPLEPQRPSSPNVPLNLAFGALAGLVAGLGLVFLREFSDRSVKTPNDVEAELGITCLGLLPAISEHDDRSTRPALSDRDLIVAARPDSGIAEAARALRTNITFMSPDTVQRTLLVTSALPEEGKTTVACSLATVFAQSGHRVLLVDTDLRRPRLHRTFGVTNDVGVSMVVTGQASIDESVHDTSIPNLWLLTSGPHPPNPAEMIQSRNFRELLTQLLEKYDRVIFDSPPILPVTDAAVLSHLVDGTVVVVRSHQTAKAAARQAVRQLLELRSRVLGVVVNAADLSKRDYRSYHYYGKSGYHATKSDA